jgi:AcrR family transcriptional regulator
MALTADTTTGARRRLDREQVLEAAEALVDTNGWDRLTMAALAGRLGVKVPSLYNHVTGLDDVRGEMQVRTMRQLAEALATAAMGRTGEEGLIALARVHRRFVSEYPHRYQGVTRESLNRVAFAEAAGRANEALLAVVGSYGLSPDEALRAELAIFSALHGFATLEANGFFGDVIDTDALFEAVVAGAVSILGQTSAA